MNWLRCTFCCLLAFSYVWVAFGQNADPRFNTAGSDRSIRRIFVPEAKLDSVLRSNLRPLEANRLDSYLQSLNAGSGEPSGEGDKETLLVGRSHLQSFHAIARLVGPDLYSDRTRLRMTDESVKQLSSRSTEKISIFPWNLAMEGDSNTEPLGGQQNKGSGIGRGGGTDTVGSSNSAAVLMTQSPKWLFDESGTPLVDSGSTEHWIDWSLRPSLESNAKELFFEIAIPRTIDGCLILELPNGAKVQSSNGVSRKFENWDSIWERLVDWPDRKEPLTPQRSDAFEVSLWGIELSGETKVRFKIELGNSQLRGKLGELPSDWGVEQLVSKQTLQYTPHEDDLRIASEWELVGARDSGRTLRIEVPAGVKVRSFQWNEKPISVTMNEGTIEIPFAAPLTGEVSNKVKLIGEFYLPWSALAKYSTSTEKRFRLPVIQLADSYVISGTTIFQDTNSNRFVGVRSDRGRVETPRKSPEGYHRVDYSWFRSLPVFECGLDSPSPQGLAESLIRLATDGDRLTASIRTRLQFGKDQRSIEIWIPSVWRINQESINPKTVSTILSEGLEHGRSKLSVFSPASATGELFLDFVLTRSVESLGEGSLDQDPWLEIPGMAEVNHVVLETGPANRIDLDGAMQPWILPDDELASWERDAIPRFGRYLVFRTPEKKLPPFTITKTESDKLVTISTIIRGLAPNRTVIHRIPLTGTILQSGRMHVSLPAGFEWCYQSEQRLPVGHKFDEANGRWLIDFEGLSIDPEATSLGYLLATQRIQHSGARNQTVPLPVVAELEVVDRLVTLSDDCVLMKPDVVKSRRLKSLNEIAYVWNEQGNQTRAIEILDARGNGESSFLITDRDEDLLIDGSGNQILQIATEISAMDDSVGDLELSIPEGWRITSGRSVPTLGSPIQLNPKEVQGGWRVQAPSKASGGMARVELLLKAPFGTQSQTKGTNSPSLLGQLQVESKHEILWPKVIFRNATTVGSTSRRLVYPEKMRLALSTNQQFTTVVPYYDSNQPIKTTFWNWSIWDWWSESRNSFVEIDDKERVSQDRISYQPPMSLGVGQGWKAVETTKFFSSRNIGDEPRVIAVLRSDPRNLSGWVLFLTTVVSLAWVKRLPRLFAFLGLVSLICGMPNGFGLAWLAREIFLGGSIGALLAALMALVTTRSTRSGGLQNHDRSSTWDQPVAKASLTLGCFLLFIGLVGSDGRDIEVSVFGQEPQVSSNAVYDIIIPIDSDGELAGSFVYVPEELVSRAETALRKQSQRDNRVRPAAAKHSLRLDSRLLGFGSTEQSLTSTYEVWVPEGASGRALLIPFANDVIKLNRFSVDGVEVLPSRLSRTETDIIWFSDRAGRRLIQIEGQVRIRTLDWQETNQRFPSFGAAEARSTKAWGIQAAIWPTANAILEVETDGIWRIQVDSFGRSSTPVSGKQLIQLGNKSKIEGAFQPLLGNGARSNPITPPIDGSGNVGDYAALNTEFLIDDEQVIARTILDYPQNLISSNEVEIESDLQWLPIGTAWGDGTLVDTRPGSTLDRRRYIVRWNQPGQFGSESNANAGQKREIVTFWVPVGESPLRSLLFAECRDRRVRPGTLRYSRSPGSLWILDGISNWILAINAKERLEWPELKESPLTANLRIPSSNAIGVLRQQTQLSDSSILIANDLFIGGSKYRLSSRLKRRSPFGNRIPFIVKLPEGFRADRISWANGNIEFQQWISEEHYYVQIFLDRSSELVSDLTIESTRGIDALSVGEFTRSIPKLEISGFKIQDQTNSISADPSWMIKTVKGIGSDPSWKQGNGEQSDLILLSNQDAEGAELQLKRIAKRWSGHVFCRLETKESRRELQVFGLRDPSDQEPWVGLELSFPRELANNFDSANPVRDYNDLRWNRRKLMISPNTNDPKSEFDFQINFLLEPSFSSDLSSASRSIQLDQPGSPVWLVLPKDKLETVGTANGVMPIEQAQAVLQRIGLNPYEFGICGSESTVRKGLGTPPQTSTSSGQQLAIHTKQTSDRIYSQIWVVRPQDALENNYLVKPFPRGWECSGIRVDGKVVSFERTNNQLRIFYPAVFDAYYLEMWITPPKEWNDDVLRQMTPSDPEVDEIERAKVFIVDQSSEGLGGGAYQLLAEDERRRITPKELIDAELSGWLPLANLVDNNCPETTWRLTAQRVATLLWEQAEVDGYQFSVNEQDKVSSWIRLMGAFPWKDGRDFSASVLSARTRTFVSSPLTDAEISRASTLTWSNNISEEFLHLIPPVVLYSAYLFFAWRSRKLMVKKPWWQLLFLAAGWWFIAGDLWIPTIMAAIAAILVVDTYLLASEQFRQTGIRGPR